VPLFGVGFEAVEVTQLPSATVAKSELQVVHVVISELQIAQLGTVQLLFEEPFAGTLVELASVVEFVWPVVLPVVFVVLVMLLVLPMLLELFTALF